MGYGKELEKVNSAKFHWPSENEDYFEFHSDTCDLEEKHMSTLLGKVCNRCVKV